MNKLKLNFEFPAELVSSLNEQLAYCDQRIKSWDLKDIDKSVIMYELSDLSVLPEIQEKILFIATRIVGKGRVPPHKEIGKVDVSKEPIFDSRLEYNLKEIGWVKKMGEGIYSLKGPAAALYRIFDEIFFNLSVDLGAEEVKFPSLLGKDFLQSIDYFSSFPQYTTFVSHLKPELGNINSFMERQIGNTGEFGITTEELSPISTILSPTVCYHAYDYLSNSTLDSSELNLTSKCNCYRWESSNMSHLRRLWEFEMREYIFIGDLDHVISKRKESMEKTIDICKSLGLKAWVETANDSFFISDISSKKQAYQRGMGMKWELRIPYDKNSNSVAAASFNYMQQTFGDNCSIRLKDGSSAFSGCAGWGIERWVFAFLAQKGFDLDKWPEFIKSKLIH